VWRLILSGALNCAWAALSLCFCILLSGADLFWSTGKAKRESTAGQYNSRYDSSSHNKSTVPSHVFWRVGQALGLILRVADPLVFKGPCFRLLVWVRRRGPALDDRMFRFRHVHVRVRCPRTAGLGDPAEQQVSDCLEPGFQIK